MATQKPGGVFFDPGNPWSVYVEIKVQLYLQQLAVKLEQWLQTGHGVRPPHRSELLVPFRHVATFHPLPYEVVRHYGSVNRFGRERVELDWLERGLGDRYVGIALARVWCV
jgi:hypothetical protein